MERLLWGWVAGVMTLWLWPVLPVWWLCPLALLCVLLMCRRRVSRGVATDARRASGLVLALCGLLAGSWHAVEAAREQMRDWIPPACEGVTLLAEGVVEGLPEPADPLGVRFRFRPESLSEPDCLPATGRWQLSWRQDVPLRPGERWRLQVRLKRPQGTQNPGGFDAERWWHQEGVAATGWAASGERLAPAGHSLDDLRWRIRQRLLARFPDRPEAAGTVLALLTGDRVGISPEAWERYSRTGITHLVAISGVHITMVAWLVAWLLRACWVRVPGLALWQPAGRIAGLGGWLAAAGYGALAGMELPTQRTLLMLGVIVLMRWLPGELAGRQILLLALAVVLLVDPLAIHAVGLWLSFAAVALLMAGGLAPGEEGGWRAALRAQWLATWGLMPLSLALFARLSWVSLPVNMIAIPWVTFAVVPLAMLGLLLQPLHAPAGDLAWRTAVWLMAGLDAVLHFAAGLPGAWAEFSLPGATPWWLALALALLLMPRALPGRALAVLPLLAVVWPHPPLAHGQLRLTVLDAGQGLAVHVQTAHHDLLYDTGPALGPRADAGSRVVLPYLRWQRVRRLDALVISHDDLDHSGGAGSVLDGLPVAMVHGDWPSLLADRPVGGRPPVRACVAGEGWHWDGVEFDWLWPSPELRMARDNDRSCVLRIRAQGFTVLIPGDIEARAELALRLLSPPGALRADLLVLPHHGSRTSSTDGFLDAVAPREAIAAMGYRNRFRHPAAVVTRRLEDREVVLRRSDRDGALRYEFLLPGEFPVAQRWRHLRARYWLAMPEPPGP